MTETMQVELRQVEIPAGRLTLPGELSLPPQAVGLVVFAHGSGSSRFSPRNQQVAADLQQTGMATLLFDLLTEAESQTRANVFDMSLLADRLLAATSWLAEDPATQELRLGYFGASTGAAAYTLSGMTYGARYVRVSSRSASASPTNFSVFPSNFSCRPTR